MLIVELHGGLSVDFITLYIELDQLLTCISSLCDKLS